MRDSTTEGVSCEWFFCAEFAGMEKNIFFRVVHKIKMCQTKWENEHRKQDMRCTLLHRAMCVMYTVTTEWMRNIFRWIAFVRGFVEMVWASGRGVAHKIDYMCIWTNEILQQIPSSASASLRASEQQQQFHANQLMCKNDLLIRRIIKKKLALIKYLVQTLNCDTFHC
jgi:hypothetical protein